jgi:hypothetical protein
MGWYYGDDRCIGAVFWDDASGNDEILDDELDVIKEVTRVGDEYFYPGAIKIQNNGSTTGSYIYTDIDTADLTPVFTSAIRASAINTTVNTAIQVLVADGNENTGVGGWGYCKKQSIGWVSTNSNNRSVKFLGESDDNDTLNVWFCGYRINR